MIYAHIGLIFKPKGCKMKILIVVVALFLSACCGPEGVHGSNGSNGHDGATGSQGTAGTNGSNGSNGTNGTNGMDGATGAQGIQGLQGLQGITGPAGADGTMVTLVKLCPETPTYGVFVEFGMCINGKLYGVYSANGGFLALLSNGNYTSAGIGSSCNLTVTGCVVSR